MLDLLMKRRSVRKYKDQKIEKELIDKIVQGALTSPSGKNLKPWELILVEDKNTLEKLGSLRGPASKPIADSSLALVVLGDPELSDTWVEDCSIVSTIVQLTAQSLGLGSCWIQVKERFSPADENVGDLVKEILSIPDKYRVLSMIALGYPDEDKEAHEKDKLKYDKLHYDKFS